ncbi:hypothetical protein Q1695_011295 [Nippostrongylus brasiliensis]|nr:hypothetical protein Q1695_011295 [Nippostrongylus brasiliensis]
MAVVWGSWFFVAAHSCVRKGFECANRNNATVGFCCSSETDKEPIWTQDTRIDDDGFISPGSGDAHQVLKAQPVPMHSADTDFMTVLSCPEGREPVYLAGSQLIRECTGSDQSNMKCPEEATCVTAPRDVLRRSVCCEDASKADEKGVQLTEVK